MKSLYLYWSDDNDDDDDFEERKVTRWGANRFRCDLRFCSMWRSRNGTITATLAATFACGVILGFWEEDDDDDDEEEEEPSSLGRFFVVVDCCCCCCCRCCCCSNLAFSSALARARWGSAASWALGGCHWEAFDSA